jgi:multisubunit Na+/H+ antiporter MnhG subunit
VILGVQVPYPSIADVFYLAGYIPAFLSILGFMRIFQRLVTPLKKIVSALVGLLILGVTAVFLLTPLSLSSSPVFVKAFDLAYPVMDAVLMALVTTRLIAFIGTSLGRPWTWIFCGLLLYSFADIMFSWGTLAGWYYSGHPIELLWLYGYLAFALGFNRQRAQFSEPTA